MSRVRRPPRRIRLAVVAAPAAQLALVGALVRWRPAEVEPSSLRSATGDDLLVATAWAVAVAVALWLLVVTLACVISCRRRAPSRPSALSRLAPAGIRRVVEAAFATTVVLAPAGTALAAGSARASVPVVPVHMVAGPAASGVDEPVVRTPAAPTSTTPTTATPPPAVAVPAPTPAPIPRAQPVSRTHVVVSGDNLWAIARAEVSSGGAPTDDGRVARYWRTLVAHNRTTLRSGDPNLIYPGELVTLPPVSPG